MPQIDYKRKEVTEAQPDWETVSDCVEGERTIKKKREKYLPKPTGERDATYAEARYKAYLLRAVFYNATGKTLEGLVGQVFQEGSTIDLPPVLEPYEDDIDGAGTSLDQQSKSVLTDVLKFGHGGLLSDFPTTTGEEVTKKDIEDMRIRPRVMFVEPKRIINWRLTNIGGETVVSLVMLEEEAIKEGSDDGYTFETETHWREIRLVPVDGQTPSTSPKDLKHQVVVMVWRIRDKYATEEEKFEMVEPPVVLIGANKQPLQRINFQFVGSKSNEPAIDKSPILDIAELNTAHYRNSADYEESSYMAGQPTPVITGLSKDWAKEHIKGKVVLGSRSAVPLPKDSKMELIQAEPNSMPFEAMKHKEDQMKSLGAKLIEPTATKGTATEAVIEEASESSILSTATKNVSEAYRKALYNASLFVGEVDPDSIIFELNSDFQAARMSAQERQQLVSEWQTGGITWGEFRAQLKKAGIATEDDEEAKEEIANTMVPVGDTVE